MSFSFRYCTLICAAILGFSSALNAQQETTSTETLDPTLIEFDQILQSESATPTPNGGNQKPVALPKAAVLESKMVEAEPATKLLEPILLGPQQTHDQHSKNQSSLSPLAFNIDYPDAIVLNESAEIKIKVTNPNTIEVREAKLILTLPRNVRFAGAVPTPVSITEKQIEFTLNDLFAGGTSEVVLNVLPVDKNPISFETQLMIVNRERVEIAVQEPVLEVFVTGPERVIVGEPAEFEVVVINTGDGPARNVQIKPALAKGMELFQTPSQNLAHNELKTGEKHSFKLKTLATLEGQGKLELQAIAKAAQVKTTATSFLIVKPELQLDAVGPKSAFVNHDNTYGFTLKNTSDVDLNEVRVTLVVPNGQRIATVSRECEGNASQGQLIWKLGRLKAGDSTEVQWISSAQRVGNYAFNFVMESRETRARNVSLPTTVEARPDLTMTIRNERDPVPTGEATEYLVVIENHGATAANNLTVQVELPSNWVAISKNETSLPKAQRLVEFQVGTIAAKQKQELRFKAGSNVPGEYVIRAKLGLGANNLTLVAEDNTLVFKSESHRVSETSEPNIR